MHPGYTYLLVDLFCILVPFLASFHPKVNFYKQWKYFLIPCFAVAAFFIAWDVLFTHLQVWSFNPDYLIGIYVFNLPLEELLFFICIPYSCVFTYYCLKTFLKFPASGRLSFAGSWVLIVFLLVLGLANLPKLYTSVSSLFLALWLVVLTIKRVDFLPVFFISFVILQIPFFISNGILTGGYTDEPVVLYNNHYNLGLRADTIPVEDFIYAMLLIAMNVTGYEILRRRDIAYHAIADEKVAG